MNREEFIENHIEYTQDYLISMLFALATCIIEDGSITEKQFDKLEHEIMDKCNKAWLKIP